jgi:hypothetical protein
MLSNRPFQGDLHFFSNRRLQFRNHALDIVAPRPLARVTVKTRPRRITRRYRGLTRLPAGAISRANFTNRPCDPRGI